MRYLVSTKEEWVIWGGRTGSARYEYWKPRLKKKLTGVVVIKNFSTNSFKGVPVKWLSSLQLEAGLEETNRKYMAVFMAPRVCYEFNKFFSKNKTPFNYIRRRKIEGFVYFLLALHWARLTICFSFSLPVLTPFLNLLSLHNFIFFSIFF